MVSNDNNIDVRKRKFHDIFTPVNESPRQRIESYFTQLNYVSFASTC